MKKLRYRQATPLYEGKVVNEAHETEKKNEKWRRGGES